MPIMVIRFVPKPSPIHADKSSKDVSPEKERPDKPTSVKSPGVPKGR
jgi:hypothetical protein